MSAEADVSAEILDVDFDFLMVRVDKGSPKKMPKRTRGLKDLQFFAKAFLLSD